MADPEAFSIGLASLQRDAAAGRKLPPVESWNPPHCGDIDIRIARDGSWHHLGRPILRPGLVRLFASILRKDPDGYCLVTPVERMRIRVDDAPFVAVLLEREGEGSDARLTFTTNVGDLVVAGPEHPIRVDSDPESGEPSPYVHVRRGLEARIGRAPFYELASNAVPAENGSVGVWSDGCFFPLWEPAA